jgi:hypothetical protein
MPDIEPLAYYPQLKAAIKTLTGCILLTYLETHHPAPQDQYDRRSSLPVTIDLDQLAGAVRIHRRTLSHHLGQLSCWYLNESIRWAAARSAREFTAPKHSFVGRFRFYSLVGSKAQDRPVALQLRRNLPLIAETLSTCGVTDMRATCEPFTCRAIDLSSEAAARPSFATNSGLAEVLLRGSQLSLDRRSLRYPRLRAAVDSKLLDKSVLAAKQPKRKRAVTGPNEGVDPCITEEMKRIMSPKQVR